MRPRRDVIARRQLQALVDSGAHCARALPVEALTRLAEATLRRPGAMLHARWTFHCEREAIVADGDIVAEVTLRCQRCLAPYPATLRASARWTLARDDAEAAKFVEAYPEREPVLCGAGLDWAEAAEDEMLLSLPTLSQHRSARCHGPLRLTDGALGAEAPAGNDALRASLATLKDRLASSRRERSHHSRHEKR